MHHVLNIVLVILFLGLVVGHHGFEHRAGDSVCWSCCWLGLFNFCLLHALNVVFGDSVPWAFCWSTEFEQRVSDSVRWACCWCDCSTSAHHKFWTVGTCGRNSD